MDFVHVLYPILLLRISNRHGKITFLKPLRRDAAICTATKFGILSFATFGTKLDCLLLSKRSNMFTYHSIQRHFSIVFRFFNFSFKIPL